MQMTLGKGNIPLYFQLYLHLRADIISRKIPAGQRLPTTEELRIKHEVANHTVRKALKLLKEEGLISKKTKTGISIQEDTVIDLEKRLETIIEGHLQAELEDGQPKKLWSIWTIPPLNIGSIFWKDLDTKRYDSVYTAKILLVSKKNPGTKRLATIYIPSFAFVEFGLDENKILKKYLSIPRKTGLNFKSELRPWLCDVESATVLDIADGTPVFQRTWIVTDNLGKAVFVSEGINTAGCLVEEYNS